MSLPFLSGIQRCLVLFSSVQYRSKFMLSKMKVTYDQSPCFSFSPFQTAWPPELTFLFTFLELIF